MSCQDFQNNYELNADLSPEAANHLDSCGDCRKSVALLKLLSGLERVEAPKDFDFQLNAMIARGKPALTRPGLFSHLRFVSALGIVVFAISLVALSGLYFADIKLVQPVAVNETSPPIESVQPTDDLPIEKASIDQDEQPEPYERIAEDEARDKNTRQIARKKNGSDGIAAARPRKPDSEKATNSRDLGGTITRPIIQPEFDSNRNVDNSATPLSTTVAKIGDVLNLIGISVESLKVISVRKDSIGERSGVKIGDKIVAIDGSEVTGEALSGSAINVKTLTIIRSGQRKEVTLRNQVN